MVANITTGKDVYGALAYNQEKVDRGDGKVLLTHIVREPADGRFNVAATAEDLLRWMPSHYRTEKPVVHVSLNPAPEDRLDDGQLAEIAGAYMERMGWGGQPYIVFKHTDIGREHIHIVSVQVAQDGRKINDSRRNERSVAVTEELEREYGLHPAKGRRREKGQGIVPADYTRGDLKRQVAAVIKPAVATYRFQTLGEFRALLSLYNSKYSINSLVYWVTYVHNVVYSFYRSMIYCYINSTQRCAGSIEIDIIPTNGADKRKFSPFAPYFPVTNVIKRYFYPYFPAIIGIKGYSFPYFPYLSGIMKIKTALYSLFSRLDWHKTVVFPCLGEIYEGIRSLSWEIPVT